MAPYTNIHGRRGGRGLRPWLLIPKYFGVAIYFGALLAVCVIDLAEQPTGTLQWAEHVWRITLLFRNVAVPGMIVAIVCGVALLVEHCGVLLRMRWLRVKLLSIVLFMPALHYFMIHQLTEMRTAIDASLAHSGKLIVAHGLFRLGLGVAVAVAVWVIVLGRLKPRLGQQVQTRTSELSSCKGR